MSLGGEESAPKSNATSVSSLDGGSSVILEQKFGREGDRDGDTSSNFASRMVHGSRDNSYVSPEYTDAFAFFALALRVNH